MYLQANGTHAEQLADFFSSSLANHKGFVYIEIECGPHSLFGFPFDEHAGALALPPTNQEARIAKASESTNTVLGEDVP